MDCFPKTLQKRRDKLNISKYNPKNCYKIEFDKKCSLLVIKLCNDYRPLVKTVCTLAKLVQSCHTLCDPVDYSPPSS